MKAEKVEVAGNAGLDLTKLTSLHQKKYGAWAGNPIGDTPNPSRCCVEVSMEPGGFFYGQCSRKRGHGPEGAYCKQHDPAAVAARRKARNIALEAKWDAKLDEEMRRAELAKQAANMKAALEAIRAGHNDPRGLAEEVLAKFTR